MNSSGLFKHLFASLALERKRLPMYHYLFWNFLIKNVFQLLDPFNEPFCQRISDSEDVIDFEVLVVLVVSPVTHSFSFFIPAGDDGLRHVVSVHRHPIAPHEAIFIPASINDFAVANECNTKSTNFRIRFNLTQVDMAYLIEHPDESSRLILFIMLSLEYEILSVFFAPYFA